MSRVLLAGAAAVVTGGGGGIGAATVRALRHAGATVVAVDTDEPALADLARETGAEPYVADVRDPAHADRLVRHVLETRGRLDIVVANAGIGHAGDFADMTPQRVSDLVAINVSAPMLLALAAVPAMRNQGRGAIVFVSSIAGALLVPRESVYSATKAAVEAFAEPLREELRGAGISVSTVMPAVVATRFFATRGEDYDRRFPRPQPPERVAAAIVRAARDGSARVVVPPWFVLPLRLRSTAPRLYRALARRFG